MFCAKCGAPLAPGAAFCPSCGTAAGAGLARPDMRRPGAITFIAVLDIIGALLFGGSAVALLFFALRAGAGDDVAFGVVFGAIVGTIAAATLVAGIGLLMMRPFGRITQIVLSCIGLLGFPLGTIINGLILYYLFTPGVRVLFSGKAAEELTPAEVAAVVQTRSGAAVVVTIVIVTIAGIAMMGILSAIAIPNLLTAMQRSKQKRTMADLRTIATACEAYATDHNEYPAAASMAELSARLTPTYIRKLPKVDGWTHPLRYTCWSTTGMRQCDGYAIWSAGNDGQFEHEHPRDYRPDTATTQFDCDLVFSNGTFVQYPEGAQTY